MKWASLVISSLSLVVSSATLAVVLIGVKRANAEIEDVRNKTRDGLRALKTAVSQLEI